MWQFKPLVKASKKIEDGYEGGPPPAPPWPPPPLDAETAYAMWDWSSIPVIAVPMAIIIAKPIANVAILSNRITYSSLLLLFIMYLA